MNANNDNQIVYIAKSKLLEIYNDIFYDWKDEFKRTYEKLKPTPSERLPSNISAASR